METSLHCVVGRKSHPCGFSTQLAPLWLPQQERGATKGAWRHGLTLLPAPPRLAAPQSPSRPAGHPGSPTPRAGAEAGRGSAEAWHGEHGAAVTLPAESTPPKLSPRTWLPAGTRGC